MKKNGKIRCLFAVIFSFFLFLVVNANSNPEFSQLCFHKEEASQTSNPKEAISILKKIGPSFAQIGEWSEWYECQIMLFYLHPPQNREELGNYFLKEKNISNEVDDYYAGKFYNLRAWVLVNIGNVSQGIKSQELAWKHFSKIDDYKNKTNCLRNISTYYSLFNDHGSSIVYVKKLLDVLNKDDIEVRIIALNSLVTFYLLVEDYKNAELVLLEKINLEGEASITSLLKRSQILIGKQENLNALNLLKDLEENSVLSPENQIELNDIMSILLLEMKKVELAKQYRNKNLSGFGESKNTRAYAKELQKLAVIDFQLKNYISAIESNNLVLEILCDGFRPEYLFSTPDSNQIVPEAWIMEALYSKALCLSALSESKKFPNVYPELINENFKKAIYTIDLLRWSYQLDRSRYDMSGVMEKLFNDAFGYNKNKYLETDSIQYLHEAFSFSQLKKAFVFKSERSLRTRFESNLIDKNLTDEYFDLLSRKNQFGGTTDLLDSIRTIEIDLIKRYPNIRDAIQSEATEITNIQDALSDDEVFFHFITDESNIYNFVIQKNSVELIESELNEEFKFALTTYKRILTNNIGKHLKDIPKLFMNCSNVLYRYLMKEASDKLGKEIKFITLELEGVLSGLNFENFAKVKEGEWNDHNNYCLSDYAFSYVYYTHQVLDKESSNVLENNYCLGLDYKSSSAVGSTLLLNHVDEEINEVADITSAQVLKNASVTVDNFMASLKGSDLFHFAGHALADTLDRLNSFFIVMKNNQIEFDSIFYDDIVSMNLECKLVTLSACNTAFGVNEESEGVLSLARAFTQSGVQSTLASSWKTPDRISKVIIISFYDNLKNGLSKPEALRKAKIDFLSSDDLSSPAERIPLFWSNWVHYGDPSPIVFKKPNKFSDIILFSALCIVALSLFLLYKGRK